MCTTCVRSIRNAYCILHSQCRTLAKSRQDDRVPRFNAVIGHQSSPRVRRVASRLRLFTRLSSVCPPLHHKSRLLLWHLSHRLNNRRFAEQHYVPLYRLVITTHNKHNISTQQCSFPQRRYSYSHSSSSCSCSRRWAPRSARRPARSRSHSRSRCRRPGASTSAAARCPRTCRPGRPAPSRCPATSRAA